MVSSTVYYAKYPICAKSADDPRILRPRTLDGRTMTEELSAKGREWEKHPELKPKPKPHGHAMAMAMAHLDELLDKREEKQDSKQAPNIFWSELLQVGDDHNLPAFFRA